MSTVLTNNFLYRIVKSVEEHFTKDGSSLYFFTGRPLPWLDEEEPEALVLSNEENISAKSNILGLKKVNDFDINIGFQKILWQTGRVYDAYTDIQDLSQLNYYVVNDTNDVYKCIDNDNGSISTIQPSSKETSGFIETGDGYIWKYMFSISDGLKRKFNNFNIYPVDLNQQVIDSAIPGTVDRVILTNGGTNYSCDSINQSQSLNYVPIFISGTGDEISTATIKITNVFLNTGGIANFTIEDEGTGYPTSQVTDRFVPVLIRPSAEGTSQEDFSYAYGIAQIDESGSGISALRIVDSGTNYSVGEAELVVSSAFGYGELINGVITDINLVANGQNYTIADAVIISDDGSGAVIDPVVSPLLGHGSNPERELNARSLMFNVRLAYDEGDDFTISNDFRTIGLIEQPKQFSDSVEVTAFSPTLSAKTGLVFADSAITGFQIDERIVGQTTGAVGTIVDILPETNTIRIIRDDVQSNNVDFLSNETVKGGISGVSKQLSSITESEYVPYSGNILYINNRKNIQRSNDQIESLNFILTL
jgi:hypothetical protein